jgi:hypothetical protein
LSPEDPVFFAQERDDIALLAITPSKQRSQQHLQRNHASALRRILGYQPHG